VTDRLLYSVEEAARVLRCSRTRMFELLKSGEVGSVKIGRIRRVPVAALRAYVDRLVDEQRQTGGDAA